MAILYQTAANGGHFMKGSSFGYLFKTGFKNIYTNRLMSFASIGVLVACLMLIGGAALLSLNVQNIVGVAGEQNEVVAFLEDGLSDTQIDAIGGKINEIGNIESITYVSKEEGLRLEQDKEKWGGLLDGIAAEDNPLPDSYRIKLVDITENNLLRTCEKLAQIDGVAEYSAPYKEATILTDIEHAVSTVGMIVVVILAVVSTMIIANTIKITVFARSKEINIMKLVGATDTFIRLPFMIEGILIGVIAALIAFGLLWAGYGYAIEAVAENTSTWLAIASDNLIQFEDVALYLLGAFSATGAGIGVVGSMIFIRKHLNV